MAIDPLKLDWPLPAEEPLEITTINEELFLLADDLSLLLSKTSQNLRVSFIDLSSRLLDKTPSAASSLRFIVRLLEKSSAPERATFIQACINKPKRCHALFALMGYSSLIGEHLANGLWKEFFAPSDAQLAQDIEKNKVLQDFQKDTEPALQLSGMMQQMRSIYSQTLIRIVYHDKILGYPLPKILSEISTLADASLEAAYLFACQELDRQLGRPFNQAHEPIAFCILSLGKLGGFELNYRSDIDLLFIYEQEGKTHGGQRSVAASLYFSRLCELITKLLSQQTQEGKLYQVDLRLRPHGTQGPITTSLNSALQYYQKFGTTWERQALLKLRPTSGNIELGKQFCQKLEPFIYRRFLSTKAMQEIKNLKLKIEHRTALQAETYRNIKTGFGGIRDLEFIVQSLQLLYGGREPHVRSGNTLQALQKLEEAGCLRPQEKIELEQAYQFFRNIEHTIQLQTGPHVHRIPEENEALESLARRINHHKQKALNANDLYHMLTRFSQGTRSMLQSIFQNLFPSEQDSYDQLQNLFDSKISDSEIKDLLKPYGISDHKAFKTSLLNMMKERKNFQHLEPRTRAYLNAMLPSLLHFAKTSKLADQTLKNFERFTSALGIKSLFYELVTESPKVLETFGTFCAYSDFIPELFQANPDLLDEFVDRLMTYDNTSLSFLKTELEAYGKTQKDLDQLLQNVRWAQKLELLRIAFFDLRNQNSIETTMRELASLTETILTFVVKKVLNNEKLQNTEQINLENIQDRFLVLALGKFGSGTMNYWSDLDLIFLYDGKQEERVYFERVAARIRSLFAKHNLYQVDLRLRPMGSSGAIASSTTAFCNYLSGSARFWERLALTRARFVFGGTTPLGKRLKKTLETFVYDSPLPENAIKETFSIRTQLEKIVSKEHIKNGAGGLSDIELGLALVQILKGRKQPFYRNPDLLNMLQTLSQEKGTLSEIAQKFYDGYLYLRQIENRLHISTGKKKEKLPSSAEELSIFAKRFEASIKEESDNSLSLFKERYEKHRKAIRKGFQELFEHLQKHF